MTIEQRLQNIENRLSSLQISMIQMQKNQTPVIAKADTSSSKVPQVDANTKDISDTQMGLAETYETTYTSISNVELALTEVYEMIINSQEVSNG